MNWAKEGGGIDRTESSDTGCACVPNRSTGCMHAGTGLVTSALGVALRLSTAAAAKMDMRAPSMRRCCRALAVAVSSGISACVAAPVASDALAARSAVAITPMLLSYGWVLAALAAQSGWPMVTQWVRTDAAKAPTG